eukprot:2168101-Prorocentrum_lima.AAC.1
MVVWVGVPQLQSFNDVRNTRCENMCHFMDNCFWSGFQRIFDDVFELCGGIARVSILLLR